MEERKYTFYDRYQKVKYANITAEELEVLNIFVTIQNHPYSKMKSGWPEIAFLIAS